MPNKANRQFRKYLMLSLMLVLSSCGHYEYDETSHENLNTDQNQYQIIDGDEISPENKGVLKVPGCSANLLDNEYFITADHCHLIVGATATMGTQSATVDWVQDHPTLDVTVAHLDSDIRVNGRTYGHKMPLRNTPLSVGNEVVCRGYGRNTFTSGGGTLRKATVSVGSVGTNVVTFVANSAGQIPWKGDSGSACLDSSGRSTGVASTCSYSGTTVHSCNYVRADRIAEWVEDEIADHQSHHDVSLTGDLDGDGEDEIIVWRPSNGKWYSKRTDGSLVYASGSEPSWGRAGDVPLVGDLDGDGADEMVISRPSSGKWYGLNVNKARMWTSGYEPVWGKRGDFPMLGDLNNDGIDDLVIWRSSNEKWYGLTIFKTRIWSYGNEPEWGLYGDIPMVGDLDGDGEDEMIIWRPSSGRWYSMRPDGSRIFAQGDEPSWGTAGDIPLMGDLDGDGEDEMTLWRPSNRRWYSIRADLSRIFAQGSEPSWGATGDIPMLSDLDGNGTHDILIRRPSNAKWYGLRSDRTRIWSAGSEPIFGTPY